MSSIASFSARSSQGPNGTSGPDTTPSRLDVEVEVVGLDGAGEPEVDLAVVLTPLGFATLGFSSGLL
jgi:hypothetical protein